MVKGRKKSDWRRGGETVEVEERRETVEVEEWRWRVEVEWRWRSGGGVESGGGGEESGGGGEESGGGGEGEEVRWRRVAVRRRRAESGAETEKQRSGVVEKRAK
jgi:hypothetical protein